MGFGTDLKIMVSPVRIRVPPLKKALQNAYTREGQHDLWLAKFRREPQALGKLLRRRIFEMEAFVRVRRSRKQLVYAGLWTPANRCNSSCLPYNPPNILCRQGRAA